MKESCVALLPRVAAIQMTSSDDPERNVERASQIIQDACDDNDLSLIVLPENFLCFGAKNALSVAAHAQRYIESLSSLAKKHDVAIVAGSMPLSVRPDGTQIDERVRSASLLIDQKGHQIARYDKIHLFDVDVNDATGAYRESAHFEPGDKLVVSSALKSMPAIGMSICYDLRFPELYVKQRLLGAGVLTIPAAFTYVTGQAHWEILLRARAIEAQSFLIAANQTGDHGNGRKTWGHSMIIDPWGRVLSQCHEEEGYCIAELDLNELKRVRKAMPVVDHRRV